MHALVLLAANADEASGEAAQADHERFIDRLIEQKRIVLGGDWKPPVAGFEAAYLIRSDSLDEARQIAASDPFISSGAMRFDVVEWELVGVDPEAVDRDALLYPDLRSPCQESQSEA